MSIVPMITKPPLRLASRVSSTRPMVAAGNDATTNSHTSRSSGPSIRRRRMEANAARARSTRSVRK